MPRPSIFALNLFNCFIDIKTRVTFNFTFATIAAPYVNILWLILYTYNVTLRLHRPNLHCSFTGWITLALPPPIIGIMGFLALWCARIFLKINNIIKWFWRNPCSSCSCLFASSLLPFVLWVTSIITFDYTFTSNTTPEKQSLVQQHRNGAEKSTESENLPFRTRRVTNPFTTFWIQ